MVKMTILKKVHALFHKVHALFKKIKICNFEKSACTLWKSACTFFKIVIFTTIKNIISELKESSQYGSPTLIEYLLTTFNNFQPHFVTKVRSRVAYLVEIHLVVTNEFCGDQSRSTQFDALGFKQYVTYMYVLRRFHTGIYLKTPTL